MLDRQRIETLTGAHRLSEVTESGDDPNHAQTVIHYVIEWLADAARAG